MCNTQTMAGCPPCLHRQIPTGAFLSERQHLNTTQVALQCTVVYGKLNISVQVMRSGVACKFCYSSNQTTVYEALFRSL